ncbi:cytochrome c1 [Gnomoniopsis sp. IMI 355080]|nr:cytochrome c1 [Gnomoniopsis sp. IMI 355080]
MFARTSLRSTRAVAAARNGALNFAKRAASTSSEAHAAQGRRLNIAAAASTAVAVSSIAWYYHLYGSEAHAMTPAEEG